MRLIGFREPRTQPFKGVFARTSTFSTCGGTANNSLARAVNAFAISPVKWALRPASFAPGPNYTLPMLGRERGPASLTALGSDCLKPKPTW